MLVYYQHTTHPSPSAGYIRAFYYITAPHVLEKASLVKLALNITKNVTDTRERFIGR